MTLLTTDEIAAAYGHSVCYVRNLSGADRKFPKPVRRIGRAGLFDARALKKYFYAREAAQAKRKRNRAA